MKIAFKCLTLIVVSLSSFTALSALSFGLERKDIGYYYNVGDWKKVIEAFDSSVSENTQSDELNWVAEAYYHIGDLDSAERAAGSSLKISDNPDARIMELLIRARRGEAEKVMKELEALLQNRFEDHKIYTAMGLVTKRNDMYAAIPYFKKAVQLNQDDFQAWFSLGTIYEEDELFEDSTKAYKNAVRINPLSAQAQNNLGYSYKERHYYAYAVEHYNKAIRLMPDNAGFYYNVGNAYTHQEKIDEAFKAYKKAVELAPSFAKARYNMARTYLRKDMVREAIEEFKLYIKYGNKEIFRFIKPKDDVEEEIEQLELFLMHNPDIKPAAGTIAR
ncbi:MAG: tetratricopeptide repeat protein [Nitrospirae bacterium]|nr:tetratricopeptide repeat protein [Nitrospirota bacterium]